MKKCFVLLSLLFAACAADHLPTTSKDSTPIKVSAGAVYKEIKLPDGSRYVGELSISGLRKGKGKGVWPNGDSYEGEWDLDKPHGRGIYKLANGNKYQGEFVYGQFGGYGRYLWVDGSQYVGEFYHGLKNGKGVYILANGDKYIGEFKLDHRHGRVFVFYAGSPKKMQQLWWRDELLESIDETEQNKSKQFNRLKDELVAIAKASQSEKLQRRKEVTQGLIRKTWRDFTEDQFYRFGQLLVEAFAVKH